MCAVPRVADICSSLISCSPVTLLRYCLSAFETVPVNFIIIIIIVINIITTAICFYITSIYVNFIC